MKRSSLLFLFTLGISACARQNVDSDRGYPGTPLWGEVQSCTPPSGEILERDRKIARRLTTGNASLGGDPEGAVAYFGRPFLRKANPSDFKAPEPCLTLDRITLGQGAVKTGIYDHDVLSEEEIAFAQQVGPADRRIVDAVARTAFSMRPVWGGPLHEDLRTYARTVLAGFGDAAGPWGATAFQQLSVDDRLGTGAAQIAVATRQPGALAKVSGMMTDILERTPRGSMIPLRDRNRLYELSYALGMAGPTAQPYSRPLSILLGRQVSSKAPPYGIIPMPPVRMCAVAAHIQGAPAEDAARRPFCRQGQVLESRT